MLADKRLGFRNGFFQEWNSVRIERVSKRNRNITQVTTPLGSFDRVPFELVIERLGR